MCRFIIFLLPLEPFCYCMAKTFYVNWFYGTSGEQQTTTHHYKVEEYEMYELNEHYIQVSNFRRQLPCRVLSISTLLLNLHSKDLRSYHFML